MPSSSSDCFGCQLTFPALAEGGQANASYRATSSKHENELHGATSPAAGRVKFVVKHTFIEGEDVEAEEETVLRKSIRRHSDIPKRITPLWDSASGYDTASTCDDAASEEQDLSPSATRKLSFSSVSSDEVIGAHSFRLPTKSYGQLGHVHGSKIECPKRQPNKKGKSCSQQGGTDQCQNSRMRLDQAANRSTSKRTGTKSGKVTREGRTMMICNMPCRVSQTDLVDAIDSIGFAGKFQITYLPCHFGSAANLGYGFVYFPCCKDAERFALEFEGYHFSQKDSPKKCTVKVAKQQDGCNAKQKRIARILTQRKSPYK